MRSELKARHEVAQSGKSIQQLLANYNYWLYGSSLAFISWKQMC